MRTHAGIVLLSIALAGQGCGDSATDAGGRDSPGGPVGGESGNGGAGGGFGNPGGDGDGDGDGTLPPEVEVELDFEQPQASERYVYAANPDSGTVSIIDGQSRQIQTLETGDRPTFLRTLAGTNDAIVLNVGSQDATIIRNPDKDVSLSTKRVIPGANAIAVAPDGKHAVVYFNSELSTAGNPSGSFQDVTVLTLDGESDRATDMTVGFRPRAVFFASDSSQAFVATEDGISVLDFARVDDDGTGIARLVSLGTDIDQKTLDVAVTPDGRYALARQPGESAVRLVDLSGESAPKHLELASLFTPDDMTGDDEDGGTEDLPVEVTDLDLAPNGSLATAVLRNQSALLVLPIPGAFEDASRIELHEIEDSIVGSATIAPNGETALLYTTAAPVERLTVVDLVGDAEPRTLALRKAVQAVAIAPDSQTALVVHARVMGDVNEPGIDPDTKIDREFGYSVVRIGSGDVKLQITQAAPLAFTVVPDGSAVFVMFRNDTSGLREVQKIEAQSFLVTTTSLGSPPTSIGSVALTKQVFVSQEHPDGRITFIHWENGERQTVTGFELNSRIRD
jgi:hypothetical protein